MDRVQSLCIGGDRDRLVHEIERIITSHPRIRRARWTIPGERLVAKTRMGGFVQRQRIVVVFGDQYEHAFDLRVCSESWSLLDYGVNKRNLQWLANGLSASGFAVAAGPVTTSWRRSSRP
jgi:hypothetical protein